MSYNQDINNLSKLAAQVIFEAGEEGLIELAEKYDPMIKVAELAIKYDKESADVMNDLVSKITEFLDKLEHVAE